MVGERVFEVSYVQRVLAGGTIAPGWPAIGTAASRSAADQWVLDITPNGQGGCFVVWVDYRDWPANGLDLYAQHVLGNGQIAPGWPADGLLVAVAPGDQENAKLLPDGTGGVFLVWQDTGASDIYAHHLRGDGVRVPGWPENGLAVSTALERESSPWLVTDGEGGIIVVWGRGSNETGWELWAHRITWWGERAAGWPVNGNRVSPAAGVWAPWPAGVAPDGAGGAYIGWMHGYDINFGDADVYAIRILPDGSVAPGWGATGNPVGVSNDAQIISSVVADSAGGVMVAWYDQRDYPAVRAMVSRLRRDGTLAPGWQPNGTALSDIPGYQYAPYLAPDGQGGVYVAFEDAWIAKSYVQHLTAGGTLAPGWPSAGIPLVDLDGNQQDLDITPDGLGGAIVVWDDFRNGIQNQIYAQRYFGDGPTPVLVSLVSVAALPDRVTLVWHRAAGALSDAIVYRRREAEEWAALGGVAVDGTGRIVYEDRTVSPGARYAYRLGWRESGAEQFSAETWVDVPVALALSLEGARPNPAVGPFVVAFTLPRAGAATLELLDMAGRRVLARDVGGLGPGSHAIRLADCGCTSPGVYWLRLTQSDRSLLKRVAVVR